MVINLSVLVKFKVKDAYFVAALQLLLVTDTAIVESNRDRPQFSKYLNVHFTPESRHWDGTVPRGS